MKNTTRARALHAMPPDNTQGGAAMIEVLVSLLIFSFGILGMVAMLAKSLSTSIDAQDRSRAAMLTDEIISAMWLEGSNSPSTLSAWKSRVADATVSGLPNATTSITSSINTTTSITTTTVTLSWQAPANGSSSSNTYSTSVVIP